MKNQSSLYLCLISLIGSAFIGGCASDRPDLYYVRHQFNADDPRFVREIGSIFGPSLVQGNSVTTLLNGDEIFPAMLDSIRSAKRSITLETFIYWKGTIGKEFAEALSARAAAGVKVRVMLDWLGCDQIDPKYIKRMRTAGVQIYEYHAFHILNPATWTMLDHRTHRKILVVDGTTGFIGGVGIADEWRGNGNSPGQWRDNHYRVTGPVVAQLQGAFLDNWMQTTGEVLQGDDYFPALEPTGDDRSQICRSSWNAGAENMELLMLMSVSAASKSIRIQSAYFVPDALTRRALIDARHRGVAIQIIVPGQHIDKGIVRDASRALWGDLLKAGVEIYEYQPSMLHCKMLIVDSVWVSVGSTNMDSRSFKINDEANLNVLNADFAARQSKVFDRDLTRTHQITYEHWLNRPFLEKVVDGLSSVLRGEL